MENLSIIEIIFIGIAGIILALAIGVQIMQNHSRNVRGFGYQPDPKNCKLNPHTPPQGGSGMPNKKPILHQHFYSGNW